MALILTITPVMALVTESRLKMFVEFLRYAAACGIVLACKLGATWGLVRFLPAQAAYFVVHVIIFFVSYAVHTKYTFSAQFSRRSLLSYLHSVIGFKALDYLLFSAMASFAGVAALWAVVIATLGVTVLRFIVVRKILRQRAGERSA